MVEKTIDELGNIEVPADKNLVKIAISYNGLTRFLTLQQIQNAFGGLVNLQKGHILKSIFNLDNENFRVLEGQKETDLTSDFKNAIPANKKISESDWQEKRINNSVVDYFVVENGETTYVNYSNDDKNNYFILDLEKYNQKQFIFNRENEVIGNGELTKYNIDNSPIGSLLVNKITGIAENFSNGSYLSVGQAELNEFNTWEISLKIKWNSIGGNQSFLSSFESYSLILRAANKKLVLYIGNGSSWNIVDGAWGVSSLEANQDYYIKLSFNGNNYKVELSTDNINWDTEISVANTNKASNIINLILGNGNGGNTETINGIIDLNYFEIKANGEDYYLGMYRDYKLLYNYYVYSRNNSKDFHPTPYIRMPLLRDVNNLIDYKNAVDKTPNIEYTAEEDCIIYGYFYCGSAEANSDIKIKINNEYFYIGKNPQYTYTYFDGNIIFNYSLKKGDVFELEVNPTYISEILLYRQAKYIKTDNIKNYIVIK